MRRAIDSFPGSWFVFGMRGGPNSHFSGVTVPTFGHEIRPGNVGTPMILWPNCSARWGTSKTVEWERGGFASSSGTFGEKELMEGYFGDYQFAVALQQELGDPIWIDHVVAEIRP